MRLPVDRVFTIAGAGTVVTGTHVVGVRRQRDDAVEVYPSGGVARVRGVQVHGEPVAEAHARSARRDQPRGRRARRASPAATSSRRPARSRVTDRFDARFTYLGTPGDDKPFVSGARVHVNHGTREVLGRVLLMDGPSGSRRARAALAQVRLEEPLAPRYDDRFIVRSYSPVYTIGGGVVLDATAAAAHEARGPTSASCSKRSSRTTSPRPRRGCCARAACR